MPVLVKILNISEIDRFENMIFVTVGANALFWELAFVVTDYKDEYIKISRTFGCRLNSGIVYFVFV